MLFSKLFIRFNWVSLVLIYLVVVAGSFVRVTGSGMGCPDWPKCFGKWIPPTEITSLPSNYREVYLVQRQKKVEKFCRFLSVLGFESTATKIKNDPSVYLEESFNANKTWVEYLNRLLGFLAGNMLLLGFFWFLFYYRKSKLIYFSALNLILIAIEAWFGSIVVATNLVPWTITVHLLLALVIIAIQIYIVRIVSPSQQKTFPMNKLLWTLVLTVFLITFYQMFLGTQVRESIDALTKQGFDKSTWTDKLGLPFYIHRSFSWLVLILLTFIAWKNEKNQKFRIIRNMYIILAIELISGVLLAYIDMPGVLRISHLVFASILFGMLLMTLLRAEKQIS